jgi:hypothetical protein
MDQQYWFKERRCAELQAGVGYNTLSLHQSPAH